MKKIILSLAIAMSSYCSYAQNVFPTPIGYVGIGTQSPSDLLHINAGAYRRGITITSDGDANAYTDITLSVSNSTSIPSGLPTDWEISHRKDGFFSNTPSGQSSLEFYANLKGGYYSAPLSFKSNGDVILVSNKNALGGNVGIGTTSPSYKLDINGSIHTVGTSELGSGYLHVSTDQHFDSGANYTFRDGVGINNPNGSSYVSGTSVMSIGAMSNGISLITTGNIGIGTVDTKGYMLAVNGSAIATSIKVALYGSWPDYVLKPSYRLPSLLTVKAYIDQNQHLPEMPSEQEVKDNGIDLGEMVKLQTKKIEELTLYIIDKDKQLTEQETRIAALEKALLKRLRKHSK